jgi:hypothetical protein
MLSGDFTFFVNHNPKVGGSNPSPATIQIKELRGKISQRYCQIYPRGNKGVADMTDEEKIALKAACVQAAAGRCIFCGGSGLTKEHLLADWLREIFPRTAKDTHTFGTIESWTPKPRFVQRVKQGHAGSRKVRKVCGPCNSGWIGAIDDAAKQAIVPLIHGQSVVVTPEAHERSQLGSPRSQWLAMRCGPKEASSCKPIAIGLEGTRFRRCFGKYG